MGSPDRQEVSREREEAAPSANRPSQPNPPSNLPAPPPVQYSKNRGPEEPPWPAGRTFPSLAHMQGSHYPN